MVLEGFVMSGCKIIMLMACVHPVSQKICIFVCRIYYYLTRDFLNRKSFPVVTYVLSLLRLGAQHMFDIFELLSYMFLSS